MHILASLNQILIKLNIQMVVDGPLPPDSILEIPKSIRLIPLVTVFCEEVEGSLALEVFFKLKYVGMV
jgi:hypothetical protein